MNSRQSTVDSRQLASVHFHLFLGLLLASLVASCATLSVTERDAFPLDPREGLPGPFPSEVAKGWKALLEGSATRAEAEFEAAAREGPRLAADIGRVEAMVLSGRARDARSICEKLLSGSEPTAPLLISCAEAQAGLGDPVSAYPLYREALFRAPGRPRLVARAEELRFAARDRLVEAAREAAEAQDWNEARAQIARALELAPESSAVRRSAGDLENEAGDKERALRLYREAIDLGANDLETAEKTGDLALELKDYPIAVSIFDALAAQDSRFAPQAENARLTFRVANWPAPEREAAQSARLTRAGAATLLWWMYPEIREARVSSGVIASDALSRRDSRAITRAVALGLLDVDRETHRVNPGAHLGPVSAARLLLRLLVLVSPPDRELTCLGESRRPPRAASEALAVAEGCGLLPELDSGGVSGPVFTKALDRVRALATGSEAAEE
jgi:tetratricopeptide (TPR) repeat protein